VSAGVKRALLFETHRVKPNRAVAMCLALGAAAAAGPARVRGQDTEAGLGRSWRPGSGDEGGGECVGSLVFWSLRRSNSGRRAVLTGLLRGLHRRRVTLSRRSRFFRVAVAK